MPINNSFIKQKYYPISQIDEMSGQASPGPYDYKTTPDKKKRKKKSTKSKNGLSQV